MHAISWAPQIITYMTVNVFTHAVEQSDNFKKTVAEFHNRLLTQNLLLTTLYTMLKTGYF